LSSGDSGQQQNQSTGFSTGKWSKAPELFRISEKLVLRIESKSGVEFIGVHGSQIQSMREPDLKNAEKLTLKESNEKIAQMKPMEPMEPHEADAANETDALTVGFHQNRSPECRLTVQMRVCHLRASVVRRWTIIGAEATVDDST
jgi:hypothetical protein